MTSREPGFRDVFDQAIGELPLSQVDVDAVVLRERRYQRRRHVLGAALLILVVLGGGAWVTLGRAGNDRSVGPAVSPIVTSTVPAQALVQFLGGRPAEDPSAARTRVLGAIRTSTFNVFPGVAFSPAEPGRDTWAVEHVDQLRTTADGKLVPQFGYVSRAIAVRDADHAGTVTVSIMRMTAVTAMPTCQPGQTECGAFTMSKGSGMQWRDGSSLHAARQSYNFSLIEVSVTNADPYGNPLGKAPPLTQSQVNDLAVGLNLWLY